MRNNWSHQLTLLLKGKECLGAHVAVVLDVRVDHVGGESLHEVVALEFVDVLRNALHREVGPPVDLNTEAVLVEFDFLKALLKDSGVELGVEAVARDA